MRFKDVAVVVDPFLSPHPDRLIPRALNPADAVWIDVIACTHEHIDHLDLEAVAALAAGSSRAVVVVPEPIVQMVTGAGIDPGRVIGVQPGHPFKVRSLVIHAVPASHGVKPQDAYNFGESISGGLIRYLGYVFQFPDISVYDAGDTIDYPDLAGRLRELEVSLALLPINGRSSEREAHDIVGNLGDPDRLVSSVRDTHLAIQVVIPDLDKPFVYASP